MGRRSLMDLMVRALLVVVGILLGIISMLTYIFFSRIGAAVLLLSCILIIFCVYAILRTRYNWIIKDMLYKLSRELQKITADRTIAVGVDKNSPAAGVFEEMENLRQSILVNEQLRKDILNIVDSVALNNDFQFMLEDMIPKIIDITDSSCGAFYLLNKATNKLEIKHSVGYNKNIFSEFDITLGEGLVGELAQNREIKIVEDIPDDTIYISRTFLGNIKPKAMMVIPVTNGEELDGVLVLTSVKNFVSVSMEQAELMKYYLGIAVVNGVAYETNKRLTNELKFQNKLIQDFNSELENKVAERSLLFDHVINSIRGYAIYSIDQEGMVQTWNAGAEDILGYTAAEVIGRHVNYIYTEEEVADRFLEKILDIVMQDGIYQETVWRRKKNGETYYADMTVYCIKNNMGELLGFTNVTRDITSIYSMENAVYSERVFSYRLMEYYEYPLIVIDKSGRVVHLNGKASEKLGIKLSENDKIDVQELFMEKKKISQHVSDAVETYARINIPEAVLIANSEHVSLEIMAIHQDIKDINAVIIIKPMGHSAESSLIIAQ